MSCFLITWCTYNSRISQRISNLKVEYGDSITLNYTDRQNIYSLICDQISLKQYQVLSLNVLKDHVHVLLSCDKEGIPKVVKNLKGSSSYMFFKQISDLDNIKEPHRLWAKSYSYTYIDSERHLKLATYYVQNNHLKHRCVALKIKQFPYSLAHKGYNKDVATEGGAGSGTESATEGATEGFNPQ